MPLTLPFWILSCQESVASSSPSVGAGNCDSVRPNRSSEAPYLCAAGIEVNAVGPNRRPSTATLPEDTVKSAEPRLPGIPPRPGRFLKAAAILLLADRARLELPMIRPLVSRTVIVTAAATALGFTIATPVVKLVSSQVRVAVVAKALESGTTAS